MINDTLPKVIIQMAVDFSYETMEDRRKGHNIFKCWEKRIVNLVKLPFRNDEETKTFSDKGKLRNFCLPDLALKIANETSPNRKKIITKENWNNRK